LRGSRPLAFPRSFSLSENDATRSRMPDETRAPVRARRAGHVLRATGNGPRHRMLANHGMEPAEPGMRAGIEA